MTTVYLKVCPICSCEFSDPHKDQIWCSRKCYDKARASVPRTCPICHQQFVTSEKQQTCCSVQCRGILRMNPEPPRVCAQCNKPLTRRNPRQICCSRTCSNLHKVDSESERFAKIADRFWPRVQKSEDPDACWFWLRGKDRAGYGTFSVNGKSTHASRICWILTNGPIPEGLEICHSCDTPACVNPKHLWFGTHLQNMQDMQRKGRHSRTGGPKGERAGQAKLTAVQVLQIRNLYRYGNGRELAKQYHVTPSAISSIVNRVSWRSI